MKNFILILSIFIFFNFNFYSQNSAIQDEQDFETEDFLEQELEQAESDFEKSWKEFGESSKKALKESGKYLKNLGTDIGNSFKESTKNLFLQKYYGTWVYRGKTTTTTIEINSNGTMTISRIQGRTTTYWSGVYTSTLSAINFSIKEYGKKTFWSDKTSQVDEKWYMFYSADKKDELKITSHDIPQDKDETDFSKGITFSKYVTEEYNSEDA